MRRALTLLLTGTLAVGTLTGCLNYSYSVREPHESRYWESTTDEILRAESYQDFVNILLYLIEEHESHATIRLYLTSTSLTIAFAMVKDACEEVRLETASGSYLLENLSYDMEELKEGCFEVTLYPAYRRTAEDFAAIQETASSAGVSDLVRAAYEEGKQGVTVQYTYAAQTPEELTEALLALEAELRPETTEDAEFSTENSETVENPWQIHFYPPTGDSTLVEVLFS